MIKTLDLVRDKFLDDRTIGRMAFGANVCYTLEDTYREKDHVPVAEWKVPGATAIPEGEYEVIVSFSNRFQKMLPLLLDVPGYSGVRIHPGNGPENTEGCILVGNGFDGKRITDSRSAFFLVMAFIEMELDKGNHVRINISGKPLLEA